MYTVQYIQYIHYIIYIEYTYIHYYIVYIIYVYYILYIYILVFHSEDQCSINKRLVKNLHCVCCFCLDLMLLCGV